MKPLGYLGPISQEWLDENKVVGCPHPHITSDHFSLLVELGLCPDGFPAGSSDESASTSGQQQQAVGHIGSHNSSSSSSAIGSGLIGGGLGGGWGGGGGGSSSRMHFAPNGFGR